MERPGPCQICRTQAILHGCALCGKQVCGRHFRSGAHACTQCAPSPGSSTGQPSGDLPPPSDDAPGRKT